jgi:hypothetical protein
MASSDELRVLVETLNKKTVDGHVVEVVRVNPTLWLLRIELTHREDAELIRRL